MSGIIWTEQEAALAIALAAEADPDRYVKPETKAVILKAKATVATAINGRVNFGILHD